MKYLYVHMFKQVYILDNLIIQTSHQRSAPYTNLYTRTKRYYWIDSKVFSQPEFRNLSTRIKQPIACIQIQTGSLVIILVYIFNCLMFIYDDIIYFCAQIGDGQSYFLIKFILRFIHVVCLFLSIPIMKYIMNICMQRSSLTIATRSIAKLRVGLLEGSNLFIKVLSANTLSDGELKLTHKKHKYK